jgi:hypothetical protein
MRFASIARTHVVETGLGASATARLDQKAQPTNPVQKGM